jgi:hypothetical protein
MQDKNHADVKKILLAVASHLEVKGIRGLANELGEKESKLYAWINRGSVGDVGAILSKCPEIRADWLRTGEGDMFQPSLVAEEEGIYTKQPLTAEELYLVRTFRKLRLAEKEKVIEIAELYSGVKESRRHDGGGSGSRESNSN